jgi:endogenous inhibitor of DNA gyrase (YacG/DUF329 family)
MLEIKITAAKCPTCGRAMDKMDKVEALVTDQLCKKKGAVEVARDINDDVVCWVCPTPGCHRPKTSEEESSLSRYPACRR